MLIAFYKKSLPQGGFKLLMISDEGISCIIYFGRSRAGNLFSVGLRVQTIMGQMEVWKNSLTMFVANRK